MLDAGMKAPDFSLPGIVDGQPDFYDLHLHVGRGSAAMLVWFPADFMPRVTDDLRALSAAGWHDREDLVVWGISGDSLFAHQAYAEREGIAFPLLSDTHSTIADAYAAVYEEFRGQPAVPEYGVCAVGTDWTVLYGWGAEDPFADHGGEPFERAREELGAALDADLAPVRRE